MAAVVDIVVVIVVDIVLNQVLPLNVPAIIVEVQVTFLKQLAYEYLNEIAIIIFVSSFLFSSFLFSLMYFSRFNVEYFLYFLICSFYFYFSDHIGITVI